MAMEERQTQIKEGAGLDESRLNQEFVEILQKWSTPLLVIVAIAAGGYFLYKKREESRAKSIDSEFVSLNAAMEAGSSSNLLRAAEDMTKVSSAHWLAQLTAADMMLSQYRSGVPEGATLMLDGTLTPADMKMLTDEERSKKLSEAEGLYRKVVEETEGNSKLVLLTLSGLAGQAAAAESKGEIAGAKGIYDRVIDLATKAEMAGIAETFKQWRDDLEKLKDKPIAYGAKELANSGKSATPFTTGMTNTILKDAQGNPIQLEPTSAPPGVQTESIPVPQPTPAPGTP